MGINDYLCRMKKRFNVTGVCFSDQHYVADTSAKFARIMEMIEMLGIRVWAWWMSSLENWVTKSE
jgi:hypothetical protein